MMPKVYATFVAYDGANGEKRLDVADVAADVGILELRWPQITQTNLPHAWLPLYGDGVWLGAQTDRDLYVRE